MAMDSSGFNRQMDRLARYFRKSTLTADQKDEWWQALGNQDLEDLTRAVDAAIAEGRIGQLPTIGQMAGMVRANRASRQTLSGGARGLIDLPTTPGFQEDAKLNMLRLFGPVRNARGKRLPRYRGDEARGLTPAMQAMGNLYALADRHGVDIDHWPYKPDGNTDRRKAFGRCQAHALYPTLAAAPTAADFELLNPWWVDNVYRRALEAKLGVVA